ncbi:uncharacterized protein DSM5745_09818 [Aspergillus mulundensis]|uniref:Uncharacterized protein n=1 Tax=Aspergillus mulundensis TaxID=1810919 RepID=A0A3D8QRJ8_9EURO|nr:hypothetical protein DSM5745_09818 [Aspergillus mulundensis]RDW64407.1 hypothetical protein DSM5745_09818 [Aspergillus mulundensis]
MANKMSQVEPVHILTASIRLEDHKTPAEKGAEEASAQGKAGRLREIQAQGRQSESINLISDIARYLGFMNVPFQHILCGYSPDAASWQAYVLFGGENMTDATRHEIRRALVRDIIRVQPDQDLHVRTVADAELGLGIARRFEAYAGWTHMTKFRVFEGRVFVQQVDGRPLPAEMFAYYDAVHGRPSPKERKELSLEEAIETMKSPGGEYWSDSTLFRDFQADPRPDLEW